MREPMRVALIVGSTRTGRFGPLVADWFAGRLARRPELSLDRIDLATADLPHQLPDLDDERPDPVRALGSRLATADAFVFVTPEYNRSFPAPVKNAIDWFDTEWAAKPVCVVTYCRDSEGGHGAAQLRQVFGELNAVPIRRTVTITRAWQRFAVDGSWPRRDPELDDTVECTLDQLTWWATALHTARTTTSFVP